MMIGLYILLGVIGYFIISVGMSYFLEEVLGWFDSFDIVLCSAGWPLFILFWLLVVWPTRGLRWLIKRLIKGLTRGKKSVSEVK